MKVINSLKPILCRAAIAYAPKTPLVVQEVYVAPPQKGEVRVKVISNALCHTDVYTLDGLDPEGLFPCILGHEATAVVESIGQGVTSVQVGDIVIPCYTPQCMEPDCVFCSSQRTNLCPKIRGTQGKGVMPDGTSRFTTKDGKPIFHFMGCSTFSEYTVISQISAAKINKAADLNKVCVLGCGISTGWGAAINNTTVTPGSTVAVWGLGAVGLAVIQAAKMQGARKIFAIDLNDNKFEAAKKLGATVCINAGQDVKSKLLEQQKWGIDFTYDCTGNVAVMRTALQSSHRGFGQSCVVGVAASGKQISTRPFQLVTGRKWMGTAFGGWKSRQDVPKLVNKTLTGQLPINQYITHTFNSLDDVNKSIDILHNGDCLRAVIKINQAPSIKPLKIEVIKSVKIASGTLKTIKHWSQVNNCEMTFNLFLPEDRINHQRNDPFPALYFLSGLQCTPDNAPQKSGFAQFAQKYKMAVVFPDTSPRDTNLQGINDDYTWGNSAGYYCNATTQKYKKNFNMYSYVNQQLPQILGNYFHVSANNKSITGFSMGGHGALISALRSGKYKSASAFSPISNPTTSQWGSKAFSQFFGKNIQQSKKYDTLQIIKSNNFHKVPLLIEVGQADPFWNNLGVQSLKQSLNKTDLKVNFKIREGYNHSFYYVSSFIEQHFDFHQKYLNI